MSLFDTSKDSLDRGAPSPNAPDQIIEGANKNHGTTSVNPVTDSTTGIYSTNTSGYFRIVGSGILTLNKGAGVKTVTVTQAHNLGFTPAFLAFTQVGSIYQMMPYTATLLLGSADDGKVTTQLTAYTDTTTFYAEADCPDFANNPDETNSATYIIRYYLLRETAN